MFSLAKFFGGFAFWKGEVIGKILYYLIIIATCLFVFYKLFVAPTHNTNQTADTITNITTEADGAFIGLCIGKWKIGLTI